MQTPIEYAEWVTQFDEPPQPLMEDEKRDFLKTLTGASPQGQLCRP